MKVKICGLQTAADVACAVAKGADYLGFVFANSSRQVSIEKAHELAKDVPRKVQKVGVFVNESLATVQRAIEEVPLDLVQLHGQEEWEYIKELPVPVIKAFSMTSGADLRRIQALPRQVYLLLDAPGQAYQGGSGQPFDWQEIKPSDLPMERIFIAGGLNSGNVQAAIAYFQPYGVDVSSGVETQGNKDQLKISQFIAAAKGED